MKEIYVTIGELSKITGRPLPYIVEDIKNTKIVVTVSEAGMLIPLSQFYPNSWDYLK